MPEGAPSPVTERLLVVTQPHICNAQLAIAAVRAGAIGLLDLGFSEVRSIWQSAIAQLARAAEHRHDWGVYWDVFEQQQRFPECLAGLSTERWPVLLLGGLDLDRHSAADILTQARQVADRVLLEVYSPAGALAAQAAGFDGLVLKGHESGGRVSDHCAFVFLQHLRNALRIPYWVRGGVHPQTAPAATLAGATGVVLCEQLWLTRESPLSKDDVQLLARCDGSETTQIGDSVRAYRFFARHNRSVLRELRQLCDSGEDWFSALVRTQLETRNEAAEPSRPTLIPAGADIAFGATLANDNVTTGHVIARFREALEHAAPMAHKQQAFAPKGSLSREHGTQYPIVQGPMTRVSDGIDFCESVASAGALPLLALGMMGPEQVHDVMLAAQQRFGDRPWGVGLLAFLPPVYLSPQLKAVRELRPPFALLAGGRPDQAKDLEQYGIKTYIHAPSPGILEQLIKQGLNRFVLEGNECGGHVGPRSSFTLWASAIDILLKAKIDDPAKFQVLFAGGIHDSLSAAMVALIAAPLVDRGMKIGFVLGSAYIGTDEAVATGAITRLYQQQVLACHGTVLLQSGLGHASRCVKTPFVEEFASHRRRLIRSGQPPDAVRMELEMLSLGRLRLASKGLVRQPARSPDGSTSLVPANDQQQLEQGMFMIGDIATLMRAPQTMPELHRDICKTSLDLIEQYVESTATARVSAIQSARAIDPSEPLAVIGIGCRFPQCQDTAEYWRNIMAKFNAVREVPAERWDANLFFTTDRFDRDKCYSKWGTFLEEVVFDPLEYGIPPASMPSIEPVQLIALQVAGDALRDAGYFDRPFCRDRTAVIFAVSGPHNLGMAYGFRTMLRQYLQASESLDNRIKNQVIEELDHVLPTWTEDSLPGFLNNMVAGRISNHFDLRGPNFVVDAACAASLAALQIAVEQLRSGTCDIAMVGAADATNSPVEFMSFAKVFALSPRGTPCPFDDTADGIVLGEGVGAIVLKRLSDAQRDGDDIYAVIRGIGAASDGRNRSLTAPDRNGQIETLKRAYADAGVDPATIGLVEAHGTGTALGDRVEAESLSEVMGEGRSPANRCAIGSVKSMIGHAKTAAGLASLIKVCLALKHKVLPPTNNVTVPNQHIDFSHGPLYVNTEPRPWIHNSAESPRRAGVSAFGFGGTNFHAVLEEYEDDLCPAQRVTLGHVPADIFVWTAADRNEMIARLRQFRTQLAGWDSGQLTPLAVALFETISRSNAPPAQTHCRLAVVAADTDTLRSKLDVLINSLSEGQTPDHAAGIYFSESSAVSERNVCFLFPGQGAQHPNMLRDLLLRYPADLSVFADVDHWTGRSLPQPLSQYIYPTPVFEETRRREQQNALNDTVVAQPALGVTCLFALDLLGRFGLRPGLTAGHSYGEIVALHAAGCMTRRQMIELSILRGEIVDRATRSSRGGMAVVFADEKTVTSNLAEWGSPLSLANINTPNQTVVGGPRDQIESAVKNFAAIGLRARQLSVTAAFHTENLKPAAADFSARIADVQLQSPLIPVYSNTTAMPFPADPLEIRSLMTRQLTEPVRFTQQIQNVYSSGARIFVEVGPRSTLTTFVHHILKDETHAAMSLDVEGRSGIIQLAHLLANCFALGLPVQLEHWFADRQSGARPIEELIERNRADKSQPVTTRWILSANGVRPQVPAERKSAADVDKVTAERQTDDNGAGPRTNYELQIEPSPPTPVGHSDLTGNNHVQPPRQVDTHRSRYDMNPKRPSAASQPSPPVTTETRASESTWDGEHPVDPRAPHAQPQAVTNRPVPADCLALSDPSDPIHLGPQLSASGGTPADPFQANMGRWLELQQSYQQTQGEFLRLQERYLDYLQGRPRSPNSAQTFEATQTSTASEPDVPETLMALRIPPAPTLPPIEPTQGTADNSQTQQQTHDNNLPTPSTPVTPDPTNTSESSPSATILSVEEFRRVLMDLIIDRTGYTEGALGDDLLMEADLGIDSIKRIEIFSGLTDHCSFMMRQDRSDEELLMTFTSFKTIRDIVDAYTEERQRYLSDDGDGPKTVPPELNRRLTHQAVDTGKATASVHPRMEEPEAAPIQRMLVRVVEAPLVKTGSAPSRWPKNHAMLVVGKISEDPAQWTAFSNDGGPLMCHVSAGDQARQIASNCFTADFTSPESIGQLHQLLREDGVQVAGLMNLLPLTPPFSEPGPSQWPTILDLLSSQYHLLHAFEKDLRASVGQGGGRLLNITSMGGKFGIGGGRDLPLAQAVTIGLYKSVGFEWPGTSVKNIDVPQDPDPEWLIHALLEELASGDSSLEVGLTPDARWKPELYPTPLLSESRLVPPLDRDAVILATGGARGITAEIVKQLAETCHCRFILVGRTTLAQQGTANSSSEHGSQSQNAAGDTAPTNAQTGTPSSYTRAPGAQRRAPDQEVLENLRCIRQHASSVEYLTVDVRDTERFAATIDTIYTRYGRIDGVIHGAGVTDDRLISSKKIPSVVEVVGTKIDGAQVLAESLRPESLRFMAFFSSVSARFGNPGQGDYCAANEYLNKLADYLNARWPARVTAINWGPWDRGLVTPELASIWKAMQIQVISAQRGAEAFVSELSWPKDEFAEVVIGCSIEEIAHRRLGLTP